VTDVTLIVLDLDGGSMLEDCLDSIARQNERAASVIVFDNGSRTPVATRLGARDVRVLRSEANLGFAGGANAALREVTTSYVGIINNDVVLDPDWLGTVRGALDRDDRLAGAQTIVRRPDGAIDGAGIGISDGTFRQLGHGQPVGTPLPVAWGVSATATLYRRSALGGSFFDESFFAYYEDVELSARLRASGWRLAVLPVVEATHLGSQSASRLAGDALRLRTRNRYRVARMHPGVGRISSLLWEDAKLLLKGRSSLRGVWEGVRGLKGPRR
jgi:GT2 family glycosyltransferase